MIVSAFSWKKEEEAFKRRAHGAIISAMHSALACDIRPDGSGDRAAHFAVEALWPDYRRLVEKLRATERTLAEYRKAVQDG